MCIRDRVAKQPALGIPGGANQPSRWITRERPKIDRIACPWLIRRFIDPAAEFIYVPAAEVLAQAAARNAIPYDVPGVRFSHRGERCSFDALLEDFAIHDGTLTGLSHIVRAADTGKPELTPQSAGLLAISLGLSTLHRDDHAMLEHGMVDVICERKNLKSTLELTLQWFTEGRDVSVRRPPRG